MVLSFFIEINYCITAMIIGGILMLDLLAVFNYNYSVGKERGWKCHKSREGGLLLKILKAYELMFA